jgi:DNA-binding MarR family transcriptional regulator
MSSEAAPSFENTLRVRDTCLCLHVQRAARTLARRFDAVFRPLGLSSGQFSLLNALNRPAAPSMGQVAALLAMDRTTLTAALKPLVRRGLVETAADAQDRRSRRPRLTDTGRKLLADAAVLWRQTHDEVQAGLPGADIDRLRGDLRILSDLAAA